MLFVCGLRVAIPVPSAGRWCRHCSRGRCCCTILGAAELRKVLDIISTTPHTHIRSDPRDNIPKMMLDIATDDLVTGQPAPAGREVGGRVIGVVNLYELLFLSALRHCHPYCSPGWQGWSEQ